MAKVDNLILSTTEVIKMFTDESLKNNAIALVRDHKKHCDDSDCGISTYMVAELLKRAGIELTKEEVSEFI